MAASSFAWTGTAHRSRESSIGACTIDGLQVLPLTTGARLLDGMRPAHAWLGRLFDEAHVVREQLASAVSRK